MAEKQYGVRGLDPRNTVQKFPDEAAAREALEDFPTDVLVVSEDGGRTWRAADTEEADR